jgi:hypothetical protein
MKFAILTLFTAALLPAANIQSAPSSALTVHEWGTFTSVAGADGSAIEWDVLGCRSDLPAFVNAEWSIIKSSLSGTVRMETPVMYFYSAQELDAHVKVKFPNGRMTEWYPQAKHDSSLNTMEWQDVKIQPNTTPALLVENGPNRYYAARDTDAAPLTIGGQHEKFLFYRGVGRFPVPLSARIASDGKIAVENSGTQPVPTVILFENRGGHVGYRNVGTLMGAATLDAPSLDSSLPVLRQELESALVAQGLFRKEAGAMLETWRDSWFEEGSRLIYILPTPAVDRILPLQVDPVPTQTVRVFVGRIELVTPEMQRSVESAIARADWAAIGRYNQRFLDPILNRIYPENPDQARRIEQLAQSSQADSCR